MKKNELVISSRCFFPKGAFFYSTDKICDLAREVGYEGIEFLPTWRFVWEMKRYGKLLAPEKMVASGHRDWRFDRVMETKLQNRFFAYRYVLKPDWMFPPPSDFCRTVLQNFQNKYRVPISVAWFEDTKNFRPVMLELWGKEGGGLNQGIDYKGLIKWLETDPKNHGIVLDTAKMTGWLKQNQIFESRKSVIKGLLPHTFEVHYRVKQRYGSIFRPNVWASEDSTENLKMIFSLGFSGRVVVEFGWPDLDKAPFGLISEDISGFKKLHKRVISEILFLF